VDTGVYGIVRHPFYAGTPLVLVGLGFWLESYVAVLFAVVPIIFLVVRLELEIGWFRASGSRGRPGCSESAVAPA
jgi:protein-S-isoprenylcysteine O-methyltransferase Ste14